MLARFSNQAELEFNANVVLHSTWSATCVFAKQFAEPNVVKVELSVELSPSKTTLETFEQFVACEQNYLQRIVRSETKDKEYVSYELTAKALEAIADWSKEDMDQCVLIADALDIKPWLMALVDACVGNNKNRACAGRNNKRWKSFAESQAYFAPKRAKPYVTRFLVVANTNQ